MAEAPDHSDSDGFVCWLPEEELEEELEETDVGPGEKVARAVVIESRVWQGMDVLRVYFMNDVPGSWRYKGVLIDKPKVLDWANVWSNGGEHDSIPEFVETTDLGSSSIRVRFAEEKKSWSYVGRKADKYLGKVTMELDLSDAYCGEHVGGELDKRSLVIHEFGHALGLEHEHQRPEFWDGISDYIDGEKMAKDVNIGKHMCRHADSANFGKNWYKHKPSLGKVLKNMFKRRKEKVYCSEYDQESIMHYGFNKKWLKDLRFSKDPRPDDSTCSWRNVPDENMPFLKGLLARFKKPLVDKPSTEDMKILEEAYS